MGNNSYKTLIKLNTPGTFLIILHISGVARRRKVGGGAQTFSRKREKQKKKSHGGVKVQGDLLKMIGNYWDYVQSVLKMY